MAEYIALAMGEGKRLYIGRLVRDKMTTPRSAAVFVMDDANDGTDFGNYVTNDRISFGDNSQGSATGLPDKQQLYIFTSIQPQKDHEEKDINDLDRHVSMFVDCPDEMSGIPQLFTKQWVHGMCFWERWRLQDVVFPWPQSLTDIGAM